jgi:signal transduction histidine kinase/ActR/RegA family two-component response regulator
VLYDRRVIAVLVVVACWVTSVVAIVVVGRRVVVRERRSRRAVVDAALAASPGVALFFDRNRRVVAANGAVARHSNGDPVGREVVEALGFGDDPIARGILDDLMTKVLAGETTYAELSDEDDDGSMRILEVEGHSVGAEKPLGFLQVVDATERRGRAMRSAQSERMEALGALAGGLAHDFNNLLFVTLGNLQLMAMNEVVADDEKLSKFVSRSMSAVERGAEITKSLLAVARSQPLEETTVSVNDLVKGVLPLVRQALGAGRVVEFDAGDDDLRLLVDAGRLSSCLLNLAFNARDAMGPTGTLTISVRRLRPNELDPAWAVPSNEVPSSEYLSLSVSDDGSGMPEEVAARAFEPFFTTKRAGSGTGLGLATVYAFARQSGGTATLTSRLGVGTTVSLLLPVHDPDSVAAADAPRRRAGRRVVVADDEESLAEMVAAWLIDVGIDARFATAPKAALELVEEFRPDVLVSDANFGEEMDGIELAKLAVAIEPDLAVVFMTGYSSSMRTLQELGERTLAKPFSREDLYVALSPYLADVSSGHKAGDQVSPSGSL